jgi:Kef-type K+ transport system membrane component KefB
VRDLGTLLGPLLDTPLAAMVPTLLLQIAVVCSVAYAIGWVFAKLKQPRVVGEIVAGILLGPSLFGWLAPHVFSLLFPTDRMAPLYFLSQIGILLFMFQVGLELDVHALRKLGPAVVLTSYVSILVPLAAGAGLAVYLYQRLSHAGVSLSVFAFFMGTAMSITAFPVLARILTERNLLRTKVGLVALGCAAVDDITAWCLLALLIAKVRSGAGASFWLTLTGLAGFLIFMIWIARPVVSALLTRYSRKGSSWLTLVAMLLFAFLCAWITDRIGIHALFGAFFAGVILPKREPLADSVYVNIHNKLGMVTRVFLLPLFFAFTGLRTSVYLLNDSRAWFYCALIIMVAVFGKLLGCTISTRISGMSWRDALSVGILMNTRGLIELVILNVGLELGVISPTLFSMMVIMALVTTFMATPLLSLVARSPETSREQGLFGAV